MKISSDEMITIRINRNQRLSKFHRLIVTVIVKQQSFHH